jgi:hypothetical protein
MLKSRFVVSLVALALVAAESLPSSNSNQDRSK